MTEEQAAAARDAVRSLKDRVASLDDAGLDLVLREARTFYGWQDRPVSDDLLQALYDATKFGPTSANCSPMRVIFVKSDEAKARLKPALAPGNVEKTMTAPVCAIIGHDLDFWHHFDRLFPHRDMSGPYKGNPAAAETAAFRNGTLQGAYLMMAARALGLDCGPMSGFDAAAVDQEFFAGTAVRSNFLCNLGYGDAGSIRQRLPRFAFDEVCQIA